MIKEEEIRIGNWFHHDYGWSYRNEDSNEDGFDFQWEFNDWYAIGESTLLIKQINPIVITENWLHKFSFERCDKLCDNAYSTYFNSDVDFYLQIDGRWEDKGYSLLLEEGHGGLIAIKLGIKYVHELQNLIYSLTDQQLTIKQSIDSKGKCPIDGRENRPIYILVNNQRTLAISDGKGHAYKVYGKGYEQYNSKCKPENKYDPNDYEFERGLSGMDF